MDKFAIIQNFFNDYGRIVMVIAILMEYVNIPGFPNFWISLIIGALAAVGKLGLISTIIIAGITDFAGCFLGYAIGMTGGTKLIAVFIRKFPKWEPTIVKVEDKMRDNGFFTVLICKLVPIIRTFVPLPAGMVRMDIKKYALASVIGAFAWDTVFVTIGYYLGASLFNLI